MFYQISDIIKTYLQYETLTRFEIKENNINPGITIYYKPDVIDMRRLIKIYPEIKRDKNSFE